MGNRKGKNETMVELLIAIIIIVESGGDIKAFNKDECAAGCLQIRPIYLRDVNSILGEERYSLEDRFDREKSIEMFEIYTSHYYKHYFAQIESIGMSEVEAKARIHNGGPRGWQKKATDSYWLKVKAEMEK